MSWKRWASRPATQPALAAVSNDDLLAAQIAITDDLGATRDPEKYREAAAVPMAFQPTYFTEELPQRPIDAIAAGSASDVSVMVGSTKEEALIFVVDLKEIFNEELVQATVGAVFGMAGKDGGAALQLYTENRPGAAPHELAAAIETDRMFTVPAIRLADAQSAQNADLWMYRFDWENPEREGEWGAHHFIEVPFAFDQTDNDMGRGFVGDNPPADLIAATHDAWVRFATDGNPQPRRTARLAALGCGQPAHDAVRRRMPRREQSRRRRDQSLGRRPVTDPAEPSHCVGGRGSIDR